MSEGGREGELAFFARVAAGFSHELSNAVGTANQAAGLLGDLLQGPRSASRIDPERLHTIQERLIRQTHRASDLVHQLNVFAHSMDNRETGFELNLVIRNLAAVFRRLADSKGIELDVRYSEQDAPVFGDPFHLRWAVFLALEVCCEAASWQGKVKVEIQPSEHSIRIECARATGIRGGEDERISRARILMSGMGGGLEFSADDETFRILIRPAVREEVGG